jgi:tRNA pseudouridine55 synthase
MTNPQPTTDSRQLLDGLLIIDKPADWTSHDVVAKVRKLCRTKRVGHTGTLDPFATGVLVICLNRATRLVQFLTGEDKEYLATIRFGFATDTGDLTGTALASPTSTTHLNDALIESALASFRGAITQIPPMYSAKKIGGVKLYEMARRGEEIERAPIAIEIKHLSLVSPLQNDECTIRVICSAGTYIRTLAEDIGKQLSIGAHLTHLRRTRAGACDLSRAHTLEQLADLLETDQLSTAVISMNEALALPELQLTEVERELISHGRAIKRAGNWSPGESRKLVCDGELRAIAEYNAATSSFHPRVVF